VVDDSLAQACLAARHGRFGSDRAVDPLSAGVWFQLFFLARECRLGGPFVGPVLCDGISPTCCGFVIVPPLVCG